MKGREALKIYVSTLFVSFIGILVGYLFRIVLSRSVPQEDFGLFYATLGFVSILNIFSDAGISRGVIRFFSISKNQRKYFWAAVILQLSLSALISVVVIAFLPFLSGLTSIPSNLIILGLLSLFATPLYRIFAALLMAGERIVEAKFLETERMLLVLLVFMMFGMKDASTALVSYIIGALITETSFLFYPSRNILLPLLPDAGTVKELLRFSIPIAISSIASTIFSSLDTVMINAFRGPLEVSLYEAAMPIAMSISNLFLPVSMLLYPEIAKRGVSGKRLSMALTKMVLLISIPAAGILILYPDIVMRLLFGEAFVPGYPALSILAVAAFFWALFGINSSMILGLGNSEIPSKITTIFGFLNVFVDFAVIPLFGFVGASVTTALAAFLSFAVSTAYLRDRKMYSIGTILPVFFSSLPPIIAVAFVKSLPIGLSWKLVLSAVMFVFVYVLSIKLLGVLKREEVSEIPVIGRYLLWLSA